MEHKNSQIFQEQSVAKTSLSNIIPAILSMLLVLVYNLADTFFIGQTNNPFMVAAVSLATPAFLLFMAIGMLFGVGGTSLISRKLGEGKPKMAKEISSFCFWIGTSIGIIGMIFILSAIDPICKIVGSTEESILYVKKYLGIISFGIPFLIIGNSFSNIIRAEGKAKIAMKGIIMGNLINIILDPIMILSFDWGVSGAAIATVIGNIVSALFYIHHLTSSKSLLSINPKYFKIRNGIATGVLAIGIPASLNSILMSTSQIVINNLIAAYGDMAIAGLGVAMKVNMIAVMLLIGVGTGIQPVLGYHFGAKNKKLFNETLKFVLLFSIALSLLMTIICYFGAKPIVKAFIEEPKALSYGMSFARTLIFSGPIIGILFVFTNAIQAMGAALPSLILSISRQGLIYIPVVLLFSKIFDSAKMIVAAQPCTDYIALILSAVLYSITYKKYFIDSPKDISLALQ